MGDNDDSPFLSLSSEGNAWIGDRLLLFIVYLLLVINDFFILELKSFLVWNPETWK